MNIKSVKSSSDKYQSLRSSKLERSSMRSKSATPTTPKLDIPEKEIVLSTHFNQDSTCVAVSTNLGFKIFSV